MKKIALDELTVWLNAETRPALVEALPARYYNDGHLPGAVNINVGEEAQKAPEMLPEKAHPVVVYCASVTCTNSHQVAVKLTAMGYADVRVFEGGKAAWQEEGRALELGGTPA